ncbi:hypothetical protein H8D83_00375 [Candidatus Woesearchaeota archaeon]|nr:hypothetical protein [Candidatus Woesearchaeota archaeon]MBL7050640.1 hypothetical protein [Candidatus Woesearchaeota archaeon]
MKPKIAFDLDEVVVEMCGTALKEIFNPYFNINMSKKLWLSYHFEEVINSLHPEKLEKPLTFHDFSRILKENSDNGFLENLKPLDYSIETILKLESEGFDVSYITFRSTLFYNKPQERTKYWLEQYGLNPDKVYFSQDKSKKMDELGVKLMVEDMPHTALKIADDKKVLLFSYPWNTKTSEDQLLNKKTRAEKHELIDMIEADKNITRVYDWKQIYNKIHEWKDNQISF